jgi:hypothetical protein
VVDDRQRQQTHPETLQPGGTPALFGRRFLRGVVHGGRRAEKDRESWPVDPQGLVYLAAVRSAQPVSVLSHSFQGVRPPARPAGPDYQLYTLSILSIPLLGQRVAGLQWLAIGVSYCGVLVIATRGNILALHFENPLGIGLALLSTVIWALYWILNTRDTRDPVVGLFLNFVCALPWITVYAWWTEGIRPPEAVGLAGAAYIGVFEMGVSFVLWLMALKLTDNTAKIANLIFIAPFTSLFLIRFLVGEEIHASTLIGLVLVLGGLAIQSFCRQSHEPAGEPG